MSFSRTDWVSRLRDNFIGSAQEEYTKLQLARLTNEDDNWSNDIIELLKKVKPYLNKEITRTHTDFDRLEGLSEAISKASMNQTRIMNGINDFIRYHPLHLIKIESLKMSSEEIMEAMLKEFLPEYSYLIEKRKIP